MTFGDSANGAWLAEVYDKCLRETRVGKSQVDVTLLAHMCKKEPKSAQVAMQLMAVELRNHLQGKPVAEATDIGQTHRLLIGSIYIAYSMTYGPINGQLPDELRAIGTIYPEIEQSVEFVLRSNGQSMATLKNMNIREKPPWWKIW